MRLRVPTRLSLTLKSFGKLQCLAILLALVQKNRIEVPAGLLREADISWCWLSRNGICHVGIELTFPL